MHDDRSESGRECLTLVSYQALVGVKLMGMTEGGKELHKLVKDSSEALKVSKVALTWKVGALLLQQFLASIGSLPSENPADPRRTPRSPAEASNRPPQRPLRTPQRGKFCSESLAEGCAPRMVTLQNFQRCERDCPIVMPWSQKLIQTLTLQTLCFFPQKGKPIKEAKGFVSSQNP